MAEISTYEGDALVRLAQHFSAPIEPMSQAVDDAVKEGSFYLPRCRVAFCAPASEMNIVEVAFGTSHAAVVGVASLLDFTFGSSVSPRVERLLETMVPQPYISPEALSPQQKEFLQRLFNQNKPLTEKQQMSLAAMLDKDSTRLFRSYGNTTSKQAVAFLRRAVSLRKSPVQVFADGVFIGCIHIDVPASRWSPIPPSKVC